MEILKILKLEITGIILAGGKSTRMGQDKGLMDFQGKQLIQYSIEIIQQFTSQIIISSNQSEYQKLSFPVVEDIYKNCGPIGGLHAALNMSKTKWNIVVSCDTPFIQPKLFQEMMEKIDQQDVIIPNHGKGMEPLAGIYNKKMASFFEKKIQDSDFKLRKLLRECNIHFFDANELLKKYPNLFNNLNSPEDIVL